MTDPRLILRLILFGCRRSTDPRSLSLRGPGSVRPIPPTDPDRTTRPHERTTAMTDPEKTQQTGDALASPELVTTIASVQGFGRDLPVSYHLAKGPGDRDWQEIWCGGGVLFPGRARVATQSVCPECSAAKAEAQR